MTINLRIDNSDSLADGGPLTFSARNRSFEIGRESHLDWSLPDPNRVISGRHCEIRFENGSYVLVDVSRNGTFVNGSHSRVKSPHRLADGDRIQIGHYLISVEIAQGESAGAGYAEDEPRGSFGPPPSSENGIWETGAPAPAPISRRDLMPPPKRARQDVDFAEQYLELPELRSTPAAGFDPFATGQPAPATGGTNPFARQPEASPAPGAFDPPAQGFGARAAPLPMPSATPYPQVVPMPQAAPFQQPPPSAPAPAATPFLVESEPFAPTPRPADPSAYPAQPPYAPAAAPFAQPLPAAPAHHPQSAYAPPPVAAQPPSGRSGASGGQIMARLAQGAGVSTDIFAQRDPGDVAEEIGQVLRVVIEELTQLLKARAAAKVMARSSNRTMISAVDNNPLKFIPRLEEVFEIMFARRRAGYLDAKRSMEESFGDLKRHEFATYAAMQKALAKLLEDLSPDAIEKKVSGSAFASKKGRAWDTFVATWEAKAVSSENGMLDVYLAHFADAYEKASKKN